MHQGCGIQLAYKIIKDSGIMLGSKIEPPVKAGRTAKAEPVKPPQIYVSPAPADHFLESETMAKLSDPTAAPSGSVVITDGESAFEHFQSLDQAKNILCICVNTTGKQSLVKQMGIGGWSATASIAFYDDFVAKLKKAAVMPGRRYIEVLTPCPKIWRSEPANTVEVARQAVETGLWPLFELDRGKTTMSYKPQKLASVDSFIGLQKLVVPDRAELEKSWRLVTLGKIFESNM